MASTDLIAYLAYMQTWESESDGNIDPIISEHNQFINLGDFDADTAVDSEFDTINSLACEVRDLTIAADSTQIAADAAAVAALWSFGLGMAAFAALEAAELIEQKVISSKSTDLNNKLTTADTDIAAQISDTVKNYIAIYKSNNNFIASQAISGMNTRTCRSILLQFMAEVQRRTTLTADSFRQYAQSARIVYNSNEINAVYDALDTLNFSQKTDADVAQFMNVLKGLAFPGEQEIALVRGFCVAIMFNRMGIAKDTIAEQAKEAGIPIEEVDATVFGTMSAVGKAVTVIAIIMSVVDVVFQVLDIVDVVEQCKKMCDTLNGTVRTSYKSYFDGIKTASAEYKAAISGGGDASAGTDIQQMQAQISQWGSITQFGNRISTITGTADNPSQSSGTASKTDHGFGGFNGTWQVGNWGDTLQFTR
jgi:hypothetical protein